jgi:hypothetical protein
MVDGPSRASGPRLGGPDYAGAALVTLVFSGTTR